MTRMVLLDANLLIGAFDGEQDNPAHQEAKQHLTRLLSDPQVKLALTPLIRYEVLRGAQRVALDELDSVLNDFHEFEVKGTEARRAAEIFRIARSAGKPLDKKAFDVFHWVCAELNQLEFASQDADIAKIKTLIANTN